MKQHSENTELSRISTPGEKLLNAADLVYSAKNETAETEARLRFEVRQQNEVIRQANIDCQEYRVKYEVATNNLYKARTKAETCMMFAMIGLMFGVVCLALLLLD